MMQSGSVMRPFLTLFGVLLVLLIGWLCCGLADTVKADEPAASKIENSKGSQEGKSIAIPTSPSSAKSFTRIQVLVGSLTVFTLAVLVGFEIIAKVPPTLHTPLMSGSNAISGITVVGALLAAGHPMSGFASFLGLLAVILANINVVGGFLVTHRMLLMFKKK
jgi:H+-translocating NAD(P) transhydrogenase subunit alpha